MRAQSLAHLRVLFPDADEAFLLTAIDYQLVRRRATRAPDEVVRRVSHKLLDSCHGEYPRAIWRESASGTGSSKRQERDVVLERNLALVKLHDAFPSATIDDLRTLVCTKNIFDAAETLIESSASGGLASMRAEGKRALVPVRLFGITVAYTRSRAQFNSDKVVLRPCDLFKSPSYTRALTVHIHGLCPAVPLSTVRSLVAETNTYDEARQAVETWDQGQTPIGRWFRSLLPKPSSGAPSGSSSSTRGSCTRGREEVEDEDLAHEIAQSSAAERLLQAAKDEQFARELNERLATDNERHECGCCFSDVPFEEIAVCASGQHVFCRGCVTRQVDEHVFGGAPLVHARTAGGGSGVRCMSVDSCESPFLVSELERILPPRTSQALLVRLGESALEALAQRGQTLVRCPCCSYAEFDDAGSDALWSRALRRASRLPLAARLVYVATAAIGLALIYILVGTATWLVPAAVLAAVASAPSPPRDLPKSLMPLVEPDVLVRVVRAYMLATAQRVDSRRAASTVYRCRNGPSRGASDFGEGARSRTELTRRIWPQEAVRHVTASGDSAPKLGQCGRRSCLLCAAPLDEGTHVSLHRCADDEQRDSLRLAVERAMSDAIKRVCPECGVGFVKAGGCNKVVCRCGYSMCFICRQGLRFEGYNHYCQHFREVRASILAVCGPVHTLTSVHSGGTVSRNLRQVSPVPRGGREGDRRARSPARPPAVARGAP